jgi:hypothetical protein
VIDDQLRERVRRLALERQEARALGLPVPELTRDEEAPSEPTVTKRRMTRAQRRALGSRAIGTWPGKENQ